MNWGYLIYPLKDRTPYFLKTWEIGARYQLRIASRWESQGIEGPSHQQFYSPGCEQPPERGLVCV